MRKIIMGLALIALSGCSSVSDIRENPPIIELAARRPAKDVAECIRDGWQEIRIIGGSVGGVLQSSGERYSVIAPGAEMPWHVADVSPYGDGSRVSYHFYRTWQSPMARVTEVVKGCSR